MKQPELFSHPLYTHCETTDADAIAWTFLDKDTFVKTSFKFPELEPHEIRANIIYTGLCLSDSLTFRCKWDLATFL